MSNRQQIEPPTATVPAVDGTTGRVWLTFATVAVGSFLGPLAGSIVSVALPTIAPAFGVDLQSIKWIIIIYLVVTTSLLPISGKLGQWLGATNVYLTGFLVFALGSIACAISPTSSILWLVAARALQAVGSAMIFGISPALITRCVPAHRRSFFFGILGSVVAVALIIAQPLGVVLCDKLSWPWVFWVQAPVALSGAILGWRLLPKDAADASHARLPWASIATWSLFITGAALVGEALSKGLLIAYLPFTLVATMLAAGAFALTEWKLARLFDYSLFRYPAFRQGAIAATITYAIMYIQILLVPFYFDDYLHLDTVHKVILFALSPVATVFVGPLSGALADRIGFRLPVITGLSAMTLGNLLLAYGVRTHQVVVLGIGLAITGLGSGLFSGPNYSAMMGTVTDKQRNLASSFTGLVRNVSFLIGASLGAIIFNVLLWHTGGLEMMHAARSAELAQVVPPEVFYRTFSLALLISALGLASGVVASLRFPNRVHGGAPEAQTVQAEADAG